MKAMHETQKNPYIATITVIILVGIAGAFFFLHDNQPPTVPTDTKVLEPVAITEHGVTVRGGDVTVTEVSSEPQAPKVPDYKTPLTFPDTLSEDVRTALQRQRTATIAILDKEPTNFNAWINLGSIRQTVTDYLGAEVAWSYAATIYPKSTIPFDNLGWLYLDFIKDYPKAETNFLRAIGNDTHDINAYEQLFSLYTIYGYKKETSAAADIVERGLSANPGNQTLLQLQQQLQK